MELDQLKTIFEDKTEKELQAILSRYNNSVEAAVEAICNGETITGDAPYVTSQTLVAAAATAKWPPNSPTIAKLFPSESSPTHPSTLWSSPTIVSAIPNITRDSAEKRRQALLEAQRIAWEQEEAELQRALEDSMSPSDRGLDHISDGELSELMNDPAFLASLDNDLRAAIELQTKLETAESEWQSMGAKQSSRSGSTRYFVPALSPRFRPAVQNKLRVMGASFLRARSTLGISTNEEDELVQRLEAMNEENVEEQFRRRIRREAEAACMRAVKDHLQSFLEENPDASYEAWIEELHPENAHEGQLLEGLGKTLDHRFYVKDSDHRKLWNESLTSDNGITCSRRFVPARTAKIDKADIVTDLLS